MKKIIAFMLVLCLAASLLCSCGKDTKSDSDTKRKASDNDTSTAFSGLKAKKIGTVKLDADSFESSESGLVYTSGDKKGIITPDGKSDTGLKYVHCAEASIDYPGYYDFCTSVPKEDQMNFAGLVDNTGKQLLPEKYAGISMLSDRFVRTIVATKEVKNKDDALILPSHGFVPFPHNVDNKLYTGKWTVYDLEKGKEVPGVDGTKPYDCEVMGNFIQYMDDETDQFIVDFNGKRITDDRTLYKDGSYLVEDEDGNKGTVYSTDGQKLFSFSAKDYTISDFIGGYYKVCSVKDNVYLYYLIDKKGKKASNAYDNIISVEGNLLSTEDKVYTLDGKEVTKDVGGTITIDEVFKDVCYVDNDVKYFVLDLDGNVIYSDTKGELEHLGFTSGKEGSDDYNYYSYLKKGFAGVGEPSCDWFLEKEKKDDMYELIDLRSGDALLSKTYCDFEYLPDKAHSCYYVYAQCESETDGKTTFDIYKVTK